MCKYAGHTEYIQPHGGSILDVFLFLGLLLLLNIVAQFGIFNPMCGLLGVEFQATREGMTVTNPVRLLLLLLAYDTLYLVYAQVATAVYGLTANVHPAEVVRWIRICMPRLLLFNIVALLVVVLAAAAISSVYVVVMGILATVGLGAAVAIHPAVGVAFIPIGIALAACAVVVGYPVLMSYAMFGVFLRQYRHELDYHCWFDERPLARRESSSRGWQQSSNETVADATDQLPRDPQTRSPGTEYKLPKFLEDLPLRGDDTDFRDTLLNWAHRLAGKTRVGTKIAARKAELTRINRISLPLAFVALGRHLYLDAKTREQFPGFFDELDSLHRQMDELSSAIISTEPGMTIRERLLAAIRNIRTRARIRMLQARFTRITARLGRASFEANGDSCGPEELVGPIQQLIDRGNALTNEIESLMRDDSDAENA